MWLTGIGDTGFIASAIGTIVFSLTYSVIAPWWRTIAGRIIWTFAATVAFIMMLAVIHFILGPQPWMIYIWPFAYLVLAAAIWGAIIALLRVQLSRGRARKEKG